MGVDQSTLASAPLKSQRDEDIPYTSCSISKPISSGNVIYQVLRSVNHVQFSVQVCQKQDIQRRDVWE